jgi:hypothetical protein
VRAFTGAVYPAHIGVQHVCGEASDSGSFQPPEPSVAGASSPAPQPEPLDFTAARRTADFSRCYAANEPHKRFGTFAVDHRVLGRSGSIKILTVVDGIDEGAARDLLTELLDQRRPARSNEKVSCMTCGKVMAASCSTCQPSSLDGSFHLLRVSMKRGSTDVSRMAVAPTCVQGFASMVTVRTTAGMTS